jgi:hypothetical protein
VLSEFDLETYFNTVLRPLGRGSVGSLPHEAVRYALDKCPPDAADQDIMSRVDEVVKLWQRQAEGGTAGLAEACRRCLTEDDRLRAQAAYRDPRWWRGRIRDWQGSRQPSSAGPEYDPQSADDAGHPSASAERDQQSAAEPPEQADAAVPPELPPPTDLTAEPHDNRVILRWRAPPAAPADVSYKVERLSGAGAGRVIGVTPSTTIEDPEPPGGRRVTYRVLAEHTRSGAQSQAALASLVFTPPVTDLAAGQERYGRVVGRWRTHPDVWRVDAWRAPRGSPTDQARGMAVVTSTGGFDDPQPPPGRYVYSVLTVYRDPDIDRTYQGPLAEVEVEVFDQPPQPGVSISESRERDSARITLRWSELPSGVFLQICRSAVEPAGAAGEVLMVEETERIGPPVWSGRGFTGTSATMPLPAGRWVLVPFAVAGARAVRGDSMNVDVVPSVTSPEAVRNGPDVQVSWVWPDGLRLARVLWRGDGVDFVREITLSEFLGRGGVTFRRSEAASVRITGVVRSGADELTSAAVTVTVPAQRPTLTYQVRRIAGLAGLLPWSRRRRRVVLATDLPCVGVRAVIYLHAPGAGREADVELAVRDDLDLGPGRLQGVMVTIPKADEMSRPCYVSCRATNGSGEVRVDDFGSRGREIW